MPPNPKKIIGALSKLFEPAPMDPSKRSILGLGPRTDQHLPAVVPVEAPKPQGPLSLPSTPPEAAPPINPDVAASLINTPISRRTILKQAGSAALRSQLGPLVKDLGPLTEAANIPSAATAATPAGWAAYWPTLAAKLSETSGKPRSIKDAARLISKSVPEPDMYTQHASGVRWPFDDNYVMGKVGAWRDRKDLIDKLKGLTPEQLGMPEGSDPSWGSLDRLIEDVSWYEKDYKAQEARKVSKGNLAVRKAHEDVIKQLGIDPSDMSIEEMKDFVKAGRDARFTDDGVAWGVPSDHSAVGNADGVKQFIDSTGDAADLARKRAEALAPRLNPDQAIDMLRQVNPKFDKQNESVYELLQLLRENPDAGMVK